MATDRELLSQFKKIMEISTRIKQSHVAEMMNITEKILRQKLLEWGTTLPFKIDGNFIVHDFLKHIFII